MNLRKRENTEALDVTSWRSHFVRSYVPVVRLRDDDVFVLNSVTDIAAMMENYKVIGRNNDGRN